MATQQSQLKQPLGVSLEIIDGGRMPDYLGPGMLFIFNTPDTRDGETISYVAALACPRCGATGLITDEYLNGGVSMICDGDDCSAEYHIDGEKIIFRPPQ
jgi:hypothetical protein